MDPALLKNTKNHQTGPSPLSSLRKDPFLLFLNGGESVPFISQYGRIHAVYVLISQDPFLIVSNGTEGTSPLIFSTKKSHACKQSAEWILPFSSDILSFVTERNGNVLHKIEEMDPSGAFPMNKY